MSENDFDKPLLEKFEQEILNKIPHLEEGRVVNATPLIDLTNDLKECAKSLYKLDISDLDVKVYGKFDANLVSGSIKIRPAIHIMHDAIKTGKLKSNQTIIEATSGNFGIALGQMSKLGLTVVSLVSRKLQEGVFKELRDENIRIMDLDMDICPAPGMKDSDADALKAKATAANIRSQLAELGFDPTIYDKSISEIESLLAAQDIINLAKLLSKIYDCFCPEQYDNELNIEAHRTITAVEIEQQLHENEDSLEDYRIVCSFGTGGTSGGLSKYMNEKYGKKAIHVVFPVPGQDVAGIRTKAKADGLKLYNPEAYAAQHEVDFGQAKHLLKFFVDKGHNIGESTALALYSVLEMLSNGDKGKFIVVVADGIEKYRKNLETMSSNQRMQVSLDEASSSVQDYDKIIWVHTSYTPKEEGIEMIAKSLGVDKEKIAIPKASTINQLLSTQQIPEELSKDLEGSKGKSLLICMAGNTSLMTAQVLASKGIVTESLNGGITNLPEGQGKNPGQYIKAATE
ncbi:MAG: pyridoxal-phosphate dependent enzyme [Nitrosopumilus sp.]|nr:pyridoxal-phosphate dependent enzyme [Nitrosopumilus sp.]MBL7015052.1 pyridoxal-phosphate dependent enzyme [Nitrosopumilus sp.]MBL7017482.1 pyridoxal-phosphate dependent enzyme [Nitrosopumilus sp.]